jgi:hypothetical protein
VASKSIFDAAVREELMGRASKLSPQSKPKFGKLNVNQMVGSLYGRHRNVDRGVEDCVEGGPLA